MGMHTPLPWFQTDNHSTMPEAMNTIQAENGEVVAWACCKIPKFNDSLEAHAWRNSQRAKLKANASFIVRAANSHDELVAALQDFVNGASTNAITSDHDETFANLLRKSHIALAKANKA